MKILHLITSLKIGGAESALCNFLEYNNPTLPTSLKLRRTRKLRITGKNATYSHYVAFFHSGPNLQRINKLHIPTHQISGVISVYNPIALLRLIKVIKKIKPDIIHAALWSSTIIARIIGKLLGIPVICDIHGDCEHHGTFRNFLDKITLRLCSQFVAVSESTKESFVKTLHANPKNIIVIENGINIESLHKKSFTQPLERKDFGLSESDFVVGSVGRLAEIKRYDVLLKALKPTKNIKLVLVGDGPERKQLEDLATKLGINDHVLFVGFRTDAYKFYPLFDCFALSSDSEGMSIALLEALSFGIPLISTSKTKKHDVIIHGKNGFLVPVNSPKKLSNAIQMLHFDKSLRYKMGKNNSKLAKNTYHIKNVVNKYHTIYEKHSQQRFIKS